MAKCKIHPSNEEPCSICNIEATTADTKKDDKK